MTEIESVDGNAVKAILTKTKEDPLIETLFSHVNINVSRVYTNYLKMNKK